MTGVRGRPARKRAVAPPSPRAFTTLWTADQIKSIAVAKLVGSPFEMTFGGPHLSGPSFARAGIKANDVVIPIQVKGGRLHVVAAMRVDEIVPVEAWVARQPAEFEALRSDPEFVRHRPHLDAAQEAVWLVSLWLARRPDVAALCPGEATEVVLGSPILPISVTRTTPLAMVPHLRWQSGRRPERSLRHLSQDGRIERSLTLQGIYRLTPASEAALLAPP